EVEELGDLLVQPAGPVGHDLLGVQVTLPGHARVTDHAGRTAHQGDRPVSSALQVPQQHQLHQVSMVQAGGGGVEAAIVGDRPTLESFGQCCLIRGLGDQTTPAQLVENVVHFFLPHQIGDVVPAVCDGSVRPTCSQYR